jgi:hypothetical protein
MLKVWRYGWFQSCRRQLLSRRVLATVGGLVIAAVLIEMALFAPSWHHAARLSIGALLCWIALGRER